MRRMGKLRSREGRKGEEDGKLRSREGRKGEEDGKAEEQGREER